MDSEIACPKCKTTLYRNPSMKLMVNVCGHNLCENCIELLFAKGSGSCPECGIPLRRNNYRIQLFEDPAIDKEVDIRRKVTREFNKKEEDFTSLRDYNDYLEMVEDIIYNLSNDIDVAETNQRIEEYRQRHKDEIARNRNRLSKETLELVDILAEEARLATVHSRQAQIEEEEERKIRAANKEKLIEDLMFSDADASEIVSSHQAAVTVPTTSVPKFSTSSQQSRVGSTITLTGSSSSFRSGASASEAVPFVYQPPASTSTGPPAPSLRQILDSGYCKSVRAATVAERAGGFHEAVACCRALQEAMAELFYSR